MNRIGIDYQKYIPGLASADHGAGVDSESVNMALIHRITALIQLGNITVSDMVIKAYGGATAAAKTTAIAFKYQLSGAAAKSAGADNFAAPATAVAASGVTVAAATGDNKLLKIDIEATAMPAGLPWLTLEFAPAASPSGVCQAAVVFLAEATFAGRTTPTSI